jgi:hypothetical protein
MDRKNGLNITDKMGGAEKPYISKVWTDEEIQERLEDYSTVDPDLWKKLRPNLHIRYFTKGTPPKFHPGGFVKTNPHFIHGDEKKPFIHMCNGFNAGAANWIVAYEDIEAIYFKRSFEFDIIHSEINGIVAKFNENFKKIKQHNIDTDARLSTLTDRITECLSLLKHK